MPVTILDIRGSSAMNGVGGMGVGHLGDGPQGVAQYGGWRVLAQNGHAGASRAHTARGIEALHGG